MKKLIRSILAFIVGEIVNLLLTLKYIFGNLNWGLIVVIGLCISVYVSLLFLFVNLFELIR